MKTERSLIIVFTVLIAPFLGKAQTDSKNDFQSISEDACSCLSNACNTYTSKIDFDTKSSACLSTFMHNAQDIDTLFHEEKFLRSLVKDSLNKYCNEYAKIDSTFQLVSTLRHYGKTTTNDCKTFRIGHFITEGDKDSTIIKMEEKIQRVEFKSGALTKSKINWIDDCTYTLTRISSTDPYESQMIQKGQVTTVRIVEFDSENTYTVELEMPTGRTFQCKLVKID